MSNYWADMIHAPGGGWRTWLYKPLHAGSPMYVPTKGPVTSTAFGFEGAAEWLRDQGFDVIAWESGANGGFRAQLVKR